MTTGGDGDKYQRWAQMVFGGGMWAYMLINDLSTDVSIADLGRQELIVKAVLYGFAAILIKGITAAEVSDLIRAWKGKP